jgi:predicted RNA-binding protein with RPS1 domain
VHISEMSWTRRINHPSEIVEPGQEVDVVVLEIDKNKQEISLGMKQTEVNPWELVSEKYPPGTMVEGEVRNLANYGAFIEIEPGIDGLLHISDMSWTKKVTHPNELYKKGDDVQCVVLDVDQEKQRVSLGVKQLTEDPWVEAIPGAYQPGMVVRGKVTKITNFGVFVELEDDLEGLLHISELADHKVENPQDVVQAGDEIDVKILRVDISDRKIGLSLKRAQWGDASGGGDGGMDFSLRHAQPRRHGRPRVHGHRQDPVLTTRPRRVREGLASTRVSLEIATQRPVPAAEGVGIDTIDDWIRPGIEGVVVSRGDDTRARTPGQMLSSGQPASGAVVALVAELADDPAVALERFDALADRGFGLSLCRVTHVAQVTDGGPPLMLHRGGIIARPIERQDEIAGLAERLAEHLMGSGVAGRRALRACGTTSTRSRATWFTPSVASPFAQAFAAEALARYARAPGAVGPEIAARALASAEATLAALAVVEGTSARRGATRDSASACVSALARARRLTVDRSEELRGLRERCLPVLSTARSRERGSTRCCPSTAKGVVCAGAGRPRVVRALEPGGAPRARRRGDPPGLPRRRPKRRCSA